MPATLDQVFTAYNVLLAHPGMRRNFERLSQATLDAVYDARDFYGPLVAAQPDGRAALLDLCNYAAGNGDDAGLANRLVALRFVDEELQLGQLSINNNVIAFPFLQADWLFLTMAQKGCIRTFLQRKNVQTRLRDFVLLTQPLNAVTTRQILEVIATVVENVMAEDPTYAGAFDGIARGALANLQNTLAITRANQGFGGFGAWGEGNHTSAPTNVKWHFLKHVLLMDDSGGIGAAGAEFLVAYATQRGTSVEDAHQFMEDLVVEDVEDGAANGEECADWWRTLQIRLPRDAFDAAIEDRNQADKQTANPWFGRDNLDYGYVAQFVESGIIRRNPKLIAWFMQHYQQSYELYAIRRSRHMDDVFVNSDGVKVFVVGTDGDNFIVGRIGANGNLGISSCYRPADARAKLARARNTLVWRLV